MYPILANAVLTTEGFYECGTCHELLYRLKVRRISQYSTPKFDGSTEIEYEYVPFCATPGCGNEHLDVNERIPY